MDGLVSVLIPCYNGEKFLDRCFNYLLLQDYQQVEIIFINDGSTDNSEIIVEKYKQKFKDRNYDFIYLRQENQGAAAAINKALKYVNGEYIMLYDVDDILMPQAISKKAIFLNKNKDFGMVRNNGYYVNDIDTNIILKRFTDDINEKNNQFIFEDLALAKTNNWPGSFMVRTEVLFKYIKNKEIYVSQFGQNLQIMMPVAYFSKSGYIDECLMKYVRHNDSHSAFTSTERELNLYSGYEKNRIEIIKSLDIPIKEKELYIRNINVMYSRIRMHIGYRVKDYNLLQEEYNKIERMHMVSIEDTKLYIRSKNRLYDILCRFNNFFKTIIKR